MSRMHDRSGCNGLDRIEPGAEFTLDLGKRAPRSDDQDIVSRVLIRACDKAILPRVRTKADHRDAAPKRIIDLAGLVPFEGGDDEPRSVEKAAPVEFRAQRGPIYDIEARVLSDRQYLV